MSTCYDLHCHSIASDGALTPATVVQRAHANGVTHLALTDHDTMAGLEQAQAASKALGITLISGIELSTTYQNQCLHIVGLNLDPNHPILQQGLVEQQQRRQQRAIQIGEKLAKKRIPDAYATIKAQVGDGEITRSHFADFLVAHGHAKDPQQAFDRYLSRGKPGFVSTQWADLPTVLHWIKSAGGVAVLAHPLRYKMSNKWMNQALADFVDCGGQGIEVVTGRSSPDDIQLSAQMAQRHQLYASTGSDFHSPEYPWVDLGRLSSLPAGTTPIWHLF